MSWDKQWWNEAYEQGTWKFLNGLHQMPRYAVVAAYANHVLRNGGNILDLGCGEGILQSYLYQEHVQRYVGVDWSESAIAMAKQQMRDAENIELLVNSIDEYPIDAGRFSCIVLNEVLYKLPDPVKTLEQCILGLRTGGAVVASLFLGENQDEARRRRISGIYDEIEKRCAKTVDEVSLRNQVGDQWTVRMLVPQDSVACEN